MVRSLNLLTTFQTTAEPSATGEIYYYCSTGIANSSRGTSTYTAYDGVTSHWIRNNGTTAADLAINTSPVKAPVVENEICYASAYFHNNQGRNCSVIIWFYDVNGVLITGFESPVTYVFDTFKKIEYSATAPTGTAFASIECKIYAAGTNTSLRVDFLQLTQNITLKTDWVGTDYYNYPDLNRVEQMTRVVNEKIKEYRGVMNTLTYKTNRTYSSIEFADDLNRIEGNISTLRATFPNPNQFFSPKTNWTFDMPFSFVDANRLEQTLKDMYYAVENNMKNIPYCGQYTAGQQGVY